jgi:Uncharacterized protein, 4-oxalocrotonate tautomerase homolog
MPTYTVWVTGKLEDEQKHTIASTITKVHCEENMVPPLAVQIIFRELVPGSFYIAGQHALPSHIWIRGDIRSGRSQDTTRTMIKRIVSECSEETGIDGCYFWVYLCDVAEMVEHGIIMPEPGKEGEWLQTVPEAIRARYGNP